MKNIKLLGLFLSLFFLLNVSAVENVLQLQDVFNLEYASDISITDDGKQVYFVRNYMDKQNDKKVGNIWRVDQDKNLVSVTSGLSADFSPVLSPDGNKLAFISDASDSKQIHIKWLKAGEASQITHLVEEPSHLTWSPDGKYIAFTMFVKKESTPPFSLPGKPKGAEWAKEATYIDEVLYRADGRGYLPQGNHHIFIISADGGTPRQITTGEFDHNSALSWSRDSQTIYFSTNRHEDYQFQPINSEVYKANIKTKNIVALTDRNGPDASPTISPNGKYIAYLGFDDNKKNYENTELYLMNIDGSNVKSLTASLDRSVTKIEWSKNSKGIYFSYEDQGLTKIAYQALNGKRNVLTAAAGGKSFGRPYNTGTSDFSVAADGTVAFSYSVPLSPADVAIYSKNKTTVLTQLNRDALSHKALGKIEEIWLKSSADDLAIQGWLIYPPGFDPAKKYPLILEIHGGPTTNYGPHFSTELQLMAAKGYVVLYVNPRGSDSYGKEFAQKIHHNYPGQDYDDLMSAVDAVIARGFINEKELFVTGGSGGGVLTAWIVGHTDRFAAAVVAKSVINWYSFVLTSDFYPYFYQYWFPGAPWSHTEHYMKRSPIHYVGNVKTPTMLLTGEEDHRTPMAETEQFYQALKLQKVDSAMVRIQNSSHGIYKRPSNLMSKVGYILWWFEKYRKLHSENE